jgi:hypothetical protein
LRWLFVKHGSTIEHIGLIGERQDRVEAMFDDDDRNFPAQAVNNLEASSILTGDEPSRGATISNSMLPESMCNCLNEASPST